MGEVFREVKGRDWVFAGVLTALGVLLMQLDVRMSDADVGKAIADGSMVHAVDSHSWWMVPVFAGATVPVLWWRRGVIAVTAVALVVMVSHDAIFGWVTRSDDVLAALSPGPVPRGAPAPHG